MRSCTSTAIAPSSSPSAGPSPFMSAICAALAATSAPKPIPALLVRRATSFERPEKAPPQMKRMLVVSIVTKSARGDLRPPRSGTWTTEPSSILRSACWTPSPETSRVIAIASAFRASLSISSMYTMPTCGVGGGGAVEGGGGGRCGGGGGGVGNPRLGGLDVLPRGEVQLVQHRLDVLADVARLREAGGVGDGEGHVDELRQRPRQQRLAAPRRPEQQDVRLVDLEVLAVVLRDLNQGLAQLARRQLGRRRRRRRRRGGAALGALLALRRAGDAVGAALRLGDQAEALVVVVHCHREHALDVVLADDVLVELLLHLLRRRQRAEREARLLRARRRRGDRQAAHRHLVDRPPAREPRGADALAVREDLAAVDAAPVRRVLHPVLGQRRRAPRARVPLRAAAAAAAVAAAAADAQHRRRRAVAGGRRAAARAAEVAGAEARDRAEPPHGEQAGRAGREHPGEEFTAPVLSFGDLANF